MKEYILVPAKEFSKLCINNKNSSGSRSIDSAMNNIINDANLDSENQVRLLGNIQGEPKKKESNVSSGSTSSSSSSSSNMKNEKIDTKNIKKEEKEEKESNNAINIILSNMSLELRKAAEDIVKHISENEDIVINSIGYTGQKDTSLKVHLERILKMILVKNSAIIKVHVPLLRSILKNIPREKIINKKALDLIQVEKRKKIPIRGGVVDNIKIKRTKIPPDLGLEWMSY